MNRLFYLMFLLMAAVDGSQAQQPPAAPVAPAPQRMENPAAPGTPLNVNLVNEAVDRVSPLTSGEVRELRRTLDERAAASVENVTGRAPARPVTTVYNADLSPGAMPMPVRIDRNQGSIVSFLDAAGRPWPVVTSENFASKQLVVTKFTAHQLSVALKEGSGALPVNAFLPVALEGLPTVVTLNVLSQQREVDAQVNVVVPRYNGTPPGAVGLLQGQPSLTAGDLMLYLLRTPPTGAQPLTIEGLPGALAWQLNASRMILRTTANVVTGYFRQQGLGDGMTVYELPATPIVRVSENGQIRAIKVVGLAVGAGATTVGAK